MKITTSILALLALSLLLPLRAQNTGGDTGSGVQPAPQGRSIMPMTINHKPNPTAPPPEVAAMIDTFFKNLKGSATNPNGYTTAYDTFLAGTRLGKQEDKKSAIISRTEAAFGIYGKLIDYEVYDNYSVGSNVLVLTYLSRHDMQPLRWRFIFYRPGKTWGLINMGFDDVLLEMLD